MFVGASNDHRSESDIRAYVALVQAAVTNYSDNEIASLVHVNASA